LLPVLALLSLASTLAIPRGAIAQEPTDFVSQNLRGLQSKNASVRVQAALNLGNNASEQTRQAIPALVEALKDIDDSVRRFAAFALGKIPGDRQVAVPALIEALQDKNELVRESAAMSLGSIGQNPELTVPALVRALKYDDFSVGRSAMGSLIGFGPAARTALPDLTALLKEKTRQKNSWVSSGSGSLPSE
jgi:HEAT repeat protein